MVVPHLLLDSPTPGAFADALGHALRETGFAIVAGHRIDPAVIDRALSAARAVFALPLADKAACIVPGGAGQRGYTPFGAETAKGGRIADAKEFWHVGREERVGDVSFARTATNVWPPAPEDFPAAVGALYDALERVGDHILAGVARHLGLAHDWFAGVTHGGDSILRLLHYPPVTAFGAGPRAGAHEDIDLLTLLLGAEEAGLELLTRDGRWIAVAPPPGALVVNVGDMLQRLTGGVLPSTTHRVVNPQPERAGRSRYAMPFFIHPRPEFLMDTLPVCRAAGAAIEPPITAGAFLAERLRQIGLAA